MMKNLGLIIYPDGEIVHFGNYKPYQQRYDEILEFHESAFEEQIGKSNKWIEQGIDLKGQGILSQLALVASRGIIIILNQTEGSFEPTCPTCTLVSPLTLTDNQILSLQAEKEELKCFEEGLNYVFVIDDTETEVEELYSMDSFYNKYINKLEAPLKLIKKNS